MKFAGSLECRWNLNGKCLCPRDNSPWHKIKTKHKECSSEYFRECITENFRILSGDVIP